MKGVLFNPIVVLNNFTLLWWSGLLLIVIIIMVLQRMFRVERKKVEVVKVRSH